MKPSSILASGAALFGCAAASDGYLWTVDAYQTRHDVTEVTSVASDAAASIVARRRGMTSGRSIGTMDEVFISDLNHFGGHHQELFSQQRKHNRLLIRIEGFDGTLTQFKSLPDMWIENPSRDLLDDFKAQKNIEGVCEFDIPARGASGIHIVYSHTSDGEACLESKVVQDLHDSLVFTSIPAVKDATKGIKSLLQNLNHLAVTEGLESTVLVLPASSKLSTPKAIRRAPPSEEPLDLPSSKPTESNIYPSISASNSSRPLPSAIPDCFSSEESCNKVTNSCSGHGKCYKAHVSCFKCRCGSTVVRENDNGSKKTVQWGGNACQKKDVSVPFILFASIGILLSALVAGGIGMLYGMGAQDLPSVLGAGVAGPRAQK